MRYYIIMRKEKEVLVMLRAMVLMLHNMLY